MGCVNLQFLFATLNRLAIVLGRMLCKIFNLTFYTCEAGAEESACLCLHSCSL